MSDPEEAALREALEFGLITRAEAEQAHAQGTGRELLRRARTAPKKPQHQDTLPSGRRAVVPQRQVGPYALLREIARGGMGAVYVARRPGLDRDVALKLLLGGAQGDDLERFRREAHVSARLRHPHIVAIHDVGQDGDDHYLVMDLIEGESLAQRLKRDGPLAPRAGAILGRSLAEGLAYAHRQSVLHRDLKPHNVLLDGADHAYLTDFGLAKDVQGAQGLTETGQIMGTPAYMPPEQAEGEFDLVDRRSDVYGMGATLYHALTGQPPYSGSTTINILNAVLTQSPPSPRSLQPKLPKDLETILLTCLARNPLERYPSAQALADDLGRWLENRPITARPPTLLDRATKWLARNRTWASLGVAAILGLALSSLVALAWAAQTREEAQEQLTQRTRDAFTRAIVNVPPALPPDPAAAEATLFEAREALVAAERWHAIDPNDPLAQTGMARALERLVGLLSERYEWTEVGRTLATAQRREGLAEVVERLSANVEAAKQAALQADAQAIDAATQSGAPPSTLLKLSLELTRGSSPARVALFARELDTISDLVAETSRRAVQPVGGTELVARWTGPGLVVLTPAERVRLLRTPGLLKRGPQVADVLREKVLGDAYLRTRLLCDLLGRAGGAHPELAIPSLARFTRLAWSQEIAALGFRALAQIGTPDAQKAFLVAFQLFDGSWATATTARQYQQAFGAYPAPGREAATKLLARIEAKLALAEVGLMRRGSDQEGVGLKGRGPLLDAIALGQQARGEFPNSLRVLTLIMQGWLLAGTGVEGRPAARRAQELAPFSSRTFALSSQTHGDDLLGAIADLDRALDLDPDNWLARLERANNNLVAGRFSAAIEDAQAVARARPEDHRAPWIEASAYLETQRLDECARLLKESVRRWPKALQLQRTRARLEANRGDRAATEDALARSGTWPAASYVRAILNRAGDKEMLAVATLDLPQQLWRHEAALVLEKRALALMTLKRLPEALDLITKVLALRPALVRMFLARAQVYERLRRPFEAIVEFSRVLSRKPNRPRIRLYRLRLARSFRAHEMVLRDAEILHQAGGLPARSQAQACWLGADAALSLRRLEPANRLAQAALGLDPKAGAPHRTLGEVALAGGRSKDAKLHFRRFLANVRPGHPLRGRIEAKLRDLEGR
ncbi:MAG: protein kinase [Planctomycetes bacterium]|nr:protein kinase [Planctomycetota bacterium]